MGNIKGGYWVILSDGTIAWVPDEEEGGEEPTIMW